MYIYWCLSFEGIDENIPTVHFSSKKIKDLGFEFKYNLEDMFTGAVDSCRQKGLLALPNIEIKSNVTNEKELLPLPVEIKSNVTNEKELLPLPIEIKSTN